VCAITRPHIRRYAFICATQIYNAAESYATYCQMQLMDSLMCSTSFIHACDVPLWQMRHDEITTTHCNTLQHTATHCNTLQHIGRCDMTRIQGVVFSGENTGKTEWILITTLIYVYIMLQVWGLLPNTSFELVISRGLFLPSGLYICIHTYIYIYTCIYIYKHTHTQTLYIYTYTHTQTNGCKCTNT